MVRSKFAGIISSVSSSNNCDCISMVFPLTSKLPELVRASFSFGVGETFALRPEEYQPSGSCNFSRLHSVNLNFENITTDPSELLVFATNYTII